MWVFYKDGLNRTHVRGFIMGTARVSGLQDQREREFKEGKGPSEGGRSLSKNIRDPKFSCKSWGSRERFGVQAQQSKTETAVVTGITRMKRHFIFSMKIFSLEVGRGTVIRIMHSPFPF